MAEAAAVDTGAAEEAAPSVFYITEVNNSRSWWDHVIVRHRNGAATGIEIGHARTYHKALITVHLFAKDGDRCVVTPLSGPRREFDLAEAPKREARPVMQQEPA